MLIELTCESCDMSGNISQNGFIGYCEVCGPYACAEVYNIENLVPWARHIIFQEGDILDDVEPLTPPTNDSQWLKLLQQIIPSNYSIGRNLPLDIAYEAIRNHPRVEIQCVVEQGNCGTIFYLTENSDEDIGYKLQKTNEWNYQLDGEYGHPSQFDEHLSEALAGNISGVFSNDPIKRLSYIKNLCKRVLHYDVFLIDPTNIVGGRESRWCSILPENMLLRQVLAEILLGHHGQEPLWRLRVGSINYSISWRNYLPESSGESRKKSFQYLRQIVEDNSEIKTTSMGLVIQGESGARYLLKAQQFHEGVPRTIVLNLPPVASMSGAIKQSVCIHMERGCKLPLGDRIATLALGLVNDIKTAEKIKPLESVVVQFLRQRGGQS